MTTNDHRPGFDRMIWAVMTLILLCLAAVLVCGMTGCKSPEEIAAAKVAKACAKADVKMADAIHLCPSMMLPEVRVDTVVMYTKPEAGAGQRVYSQASVDSLATICAQLLRNNVDTVEVVRRLVQRVCTFDTITVEDSALLLKIWTQDGKVRYWYNVLPQKVQAVVITPTQMINAKPCPPVVPRVKSWGWLWAVLMFCVGFIASSFMKGSHRHEP